MTMTAPKLRFRHCRTIVCCAVCLALSAAAAAAQSDASDELKTVRTAAFGATSEFFATDGNTGIRDGYAYQFLTDISDLAGWNYQYRQYSWPEAYKQLIAGNIDLLADVSYTPERAQKMLFSQRPMGTENYYLYSKIGSPVREVTDLNGRRIAVQRSSVIRKCVTDYIRTRKLNVTVLYFDGAQEGPAMLAEGSADAFVGTGSMGTGFDVIDRVGGSDFYFAIARNRPDLKAEIDSAMEDLLATDPYYLAELSKKHMKNTLARRTVSAKEAAWIASHPEIRIGYFSDCLPYSRTKKDGTAGGVFGKLVEALEKNYGFKVISVPFQDSLTMANAMRGGKLDAAFALTGSQWLADINGFALCHAITSDSQVLVYGDRYEACRTGTLAIADENSFDLLSYRRDFPEASFRVYPDATAGLEAVANNEADGFIAGSNRIFTLINSDARFGQLSIMPTSRISLYSFAVPKKESAFFSLMNHLNHHFSAEQMSDITARHTGSGNRVSVRNFISYHAESLLLTVLGLSGTIIAAFCFYGLRMRKLFALSYADTLTSLKNRNAYEKVLTELRRNPERPLGVVFADINGLKKVNDSQGHEAGDAYIRRAAECLLTSFDRENIYRVSGDEFIILCPGVTGKAFLQRAEKLMTLSRDQYDELLAVGAEWARTSENYREIIDRAEAGMYTAKKDHYNRHPENDRRKSRS